MGGHRRPFCHTPVSRTQRNRDGYGTGHLYGFSTSSVIPNPRKQYAKVPNACESEIGGARLPGLLETGGRRRGRRWPFCGVSGDIAEAVPVSMQVDK